MKLGNTGKKISFNRTKNELWYDFDGEWKLAESGTETFDKVLEVYNTYRSNHYSDMVKLQVLKICMNYLSGQGEIKTVPDDEIKFALSGLIRFFSEFEFVPNFRFTNTLIHQCQKGTGEEFVVNYFRVQDSVSYEDVKEKIKSPEFNEIVKTFSRISATKKINRRLKIYFGPQGTGKTTEALRESSDCMICHSAMLPSDLMEDFKFVDGKATFDPSSLWNAMENGTKIVLDEINLLPFESLRFLQSLLDGKTEFIYKGRQVTIKDGFEIIGTMNLVVNGMVYPLPEPLIDRCEEIREFTMTEDLLINAI